MDTPKKVKFKKKASGTAYRNEDGVFHVGPSTTQFPAEVKAKKKSKYAGARNIFDLMRGGTK